MGCSWVLGRLGSFFTDAVAVTRDRFTAGAGAWARHVAGGEHASIGVSHVAATVLAFRHTSSTCCRWYSLSVAAHRSRLTVLTRVAGARGRFPDIERFWCTQINCYLWLRVPSAVLTFRLIPKLSVIISRANTDTSPRVVATTATSSLGSRAGIQRCNEPSWPGYCCFVMDRLASGVGSGFQ